MRERGDVDRQSFFLGEVHHVQDHEERDAELSDLAGQVEVAGQIGAVHDDDGCRGALLPVRPAAQVVAGHALLDVAGREGVETGKVLEVGEPVGEANRPHAPLEGRPREVRGLRPPGRRLKRAGLPGRC
jgi:hypothetical protein